MKKRKAYQSGKEGSAYRRHAWLVSAAKCIHCVQSSPCVTKSVVRRMTRRGKQRTSSQQRSGGTKRRRSSREKSYRADSKDRQHRRPEGAKVFVPADAAVLKQALIGQRQAAGSGERKRQEKTKRKILSEGDAKLGERAERKRNGTGFVQYPPNKFMKIRVRSESTSTSTNVTPVRPQARLPEE